MNKRRVHPRLLAHMIQVGALAAVWTLAGCRGSGGVGSGALRAESMTGQAVVVSRELSRAFYAYDIKSDATFVLTDIDPAALRSGNVDEGIFVHIELLWRPKPGQTPIDATATNASIRYVIIADGEIGIYEGGGFVQPRGKLDNDRVSLQVRNASVRLQHSTAGFNDLLGTAELTGGFTAVNDPERSRQMHFAMSQLATNVLGKSMFVYKAAMQAARISS